MYGPSLDSDYNKPVEKKFLKDSWGHLHMDYVPENIKELFLILLDLIMVV